MGGIDKFRYLPHLDEYGDLVIPFTCHTRYFWWKEGGLTIEEILKEVTERGWFKNEENARNSNRIS